MILRAAFRIGFCTCLLTTAVFSSAEAQNDGGVLMPMNAWLVGPTTLAEGSDVDTVGIPCLMVTSFSNNHEMRISGGDQVIMAMALNVRDDNFSAGESYQMTLGFSDDEELKVPALAFSENTLVVGLEDEVGFYEKLQTSETLFVGLGEAQMQFSLLGVPQALKRLEQCFKGPESSGEGMSAARDTAQEDISDDMQDDAVGIKTLDEEDLQEISEVLKDAEPEIALPQEAPRKSAPQPIREVRPRDILEPSANAPAAAAGKSPMMRWRVMKGGGLQGVLEVWAASANASIIWKSPSSYSLPESLAMEGTFEEVVQAVLGLFPANAPRPVGQLYVDQNTGRKTLVIEEALPVDSPVETVNYAPISSP